MNCATWAPPHLIQKMEYIEKSEDLKHVPRESSCPWARPVLFLPKAEQLRILRGLTCDPRMEQVWKSIFRRSGSYRPPVLLGNEERYNAGLFREMRDFNRSQEGSLWNACDRIRAEWTRMPRWTASEAKKYYLKIKEHSLALLKLIDGLPWDDREFDRVTSYVPKEQFGHLAEDLGLDDLEWGTNKGAAGDYLKCCLSDGIPNIVVILDIVSKRAAERARSPGCLTKPNSSRAAAHFFVRRLSAYFNERYGSPLNAQTATVVNAVLEIPAGSTDEVTEDDVRMLVREAATRNKIAAQ